MTSPFKTRSHFGLLRAYVLGLGLLSIAACARDATELVGVRALAFDIEDDRRFRVSSVYHRELADGFVIKGQGRFSGARPTRFNAGHLDVELYDRDGALVERGILKISLHKAGRRAVPHGHYSGRFAANLPDISLARLRYDRQHHEPDE